MLMYGHQLSTVTLLNVITNMTRVCTWTHRPFIEGSRGIKKSWIESFPMWVITFQRCYTNTVLDSTVHSLSSISPLVLDRAVTVSMLCRIPTSDKLLPVRPLVLFVRNALVPQQLPSHFILTHIKICSRLSPLCHGAAHFFECGRLDSRSCCVAAETHQQLRLGLPQTVQAADAGHHGD